jgi:outer membrane receptor protein involved in Fe transport
MLEIGLKSLLLDDRLTLNVAVFDTDFTNLQVSAFDPDTVSFLINNAASAHSRGIEVEGQFLATEDLRLNYGVTLLDAEYDSYPDAQCSKFETSSGATCDRSGEDLEYSSDWSVVFGFDYSMSVGDNFLLNFQTQAAFYDEYVALYGAPNPIQDDYEKISVLLALSPRDGNWQIAAYGRNITDSKTINTLSDGVANGPTEQSFSSNRGESYGVQFSWNF